MTLIDKSLFDNSIFSSLNQDHLITIQQVIYRSKDNFAVLGRSDDATTRAIPKRLARFALISQLLKIRKIQLNVHIRHDLIFNWTYLC